MIVNRSYTFWANYHTITELILVNSEDANHADCNKIVAQQANSDYSPHNKLVCKLRAKQANFDVQSHVRSGLLDKGEQILL